MKNNMKNPFPFANCKQASPVICKNTLIQGMCATMVIMDDCPPTCPKEDNKPMACDNERRYLRDRVYTVSSQKVNDAAETFHIHDDGMPRTYAELIDFIKNDKFTLDAKKTARVDENLVDGSSMYGVYYGIDWTGRLVKDQAGYDAVYKENAKRFTAAHDIIMTQDNVAGLKALQDYEAWTPTAVAA